MGFRIIKFSVKSNFRASTISNIFLNGALNKNMPSIQKETKIGDGHNLSDGIV